MTGMELFSEPQGRGESRLYSDQTSDARFWDYARERARQQPALAPEREYLECLLAGERCLIPILALREVGLAPRRYAFLPALPSWVRGLAPWQGEAIVVVDLAAYLSGQPMRDAPTEGMLLVALHEFMPIGLHSSAIGQTITLAQDAARSSAEPVPAWIAPARAALIKETHAGAALLDLPALLGDVIVHLQTPPP